jgi:hypothetical protein
MKNIFLTVMLSGISILTFAESGKTSDNKNLKNPLVSVKTVIEKSNLNPDCSVTIEASVGYDSSYIKATCTATAANCDLAVDQAVGCAKRAIDRAKKAIM